METPPLTTPETTDRVTPDAVAGSWVEMLPRSWKPYARLARADRPIGAWLLFWPCAWGVALAGGLPQEIYLVLLFLIGSFAMRSAGCVYNDIIDRDLDASVARTRSRPLASGTVSLTVAWVLLVGLSLIGLVVLIQLGGFAQVVALGSLLLVAGYPFMKRITWWPQAWLGLTFNWGALVGFAAVAGMLPPAAVALYAAGVFWTLGYDTIYALQDIEDDALAGIKSSARRLGGNLRAGVAIFYAAAMLLLGAALLLTAPQQPLALAALIPAALHLLWQVRALGGADTVRALRLFRSNTLTGALLFAACLAAGL
ncbi:4-hydroxybenzoate octaprenyltransferase [Sphingosinicella soli]|uniref:4-hydroxybenzoate octaprenyltransferase n=1 Tax=Sphingosinicella soli TaxID=333708 RepID=A0A7W7F650_9SPHN|nr:4-hydroxybenzoate octaprenyltransferase [Sphingosinicella soli]MBB4631309.1 4-hydroxybenzoate polyprenyltransferase [Sphingosinicella soli]